MRRWTPRRGRRQADGDPDARRRSIERFRLAWAADDAARLAQLLAPDATIVIDAGELLPVDRRTASGSAAVAAALVGALRQCPDVTLRLCDVNGQTGIAAEASGRTVGVVAAEFAAGVFSRVWVVANREKLNHWNGGRGAR